MVGFTCSCTSDWMKKWCDFLLYIPIIVLHRNGNCTPTLTQVEITSDLDSAQQLLQINIYVYMYILHVTTITTTTIYLTQLLQGLKTT